MTPTAAPALDLDRPWRLSPMVSLRDEPFGALAYHHGNRRLTFLKSRTLVDLVRELGDHPTAAAALARAVPAGDRARYGAALARLAASGVLDVG